MRTIARYSRVLRHRFPEVKDIRVQTEGFRTELILKLPDKKRVGFEMGGIGPAVNNWLFDNAERWLCKELRQWK